MLATRGIGHYLSSKMIRSILLLVSVLIFWMNSLSQNINKYSGQSINETNARKMD